MFVFDFQLIPLDRVTYTRWFTFYFKVNRIYTATQCIEVQVLLIMMGHLFWSKIEWLL